MRVSRRRRVVNETERRSAGVGCIEERDELRREVSARRDRLAGNSGTTGGAGAPWGNATDGEREALRELAALCDAVKTFREERDPDAVLRALVALYDRETFARAFHERAVHDLAGGRG